MKLLRFTAILLLALGSGAAVAEKQTPPPGGEPKDFELPTVETLELGNGLRAKLVPFGYIPKAQIRVVVRTGNIDEQPEEAWLSDLLGYMLEEGAGDKDAAQLAEAFAAVGGELRVGVGVDFTWLSSAGLSESTPELLHLLADVVRSPVLPSSELDRRKDDLVRQLAVQRTQPGSQASEEFWSLLYGDHPYGRRLPEAEQVRGYELEQLRAFHQQFFGAKRTTVYVVGVFDLAQAKSAIKEAFGDWQPGTEPTVDVPEPKATTERSVHVVDRPGAAQSTLRLGLPVVDPSHPDYVPLMVTNALLGGSFASRITSNLREDKGYTYSPVSSLRSRYRTSAWLQSADVTTGVTGPAVQEILKEVDRLRSEAPGAEELKGIQNYLSGAFVRVNSNPFGIAFQLHYIDFHGLGTDYLTNYVKRIHAVTPEDVQRIAETYLDPEKMVLVVVGDDGEIASQLEGLGIRAE